MVTSGTPFGRPSLVQSSHLIGPHSPEDNLWQTPTIKPLELSGRYGDLWRLPAFYAVPYCLAALVRFATLNGGVLTGNGHQDDTKSSIKALSSLGPPRGIRSLAWPLSEPSCVQVDPAGMAQAPSHIVSGNESKSKYEPGSTRVCRTGRHVCQGLQAAEVNRSP